jgi:RimJ/RimL family protein N-acetyltransferase
MHTTTPSPGRTVLSDGRTVMIRRARAGDEARVQGFVTALSLQSRYQRFFLGLRELPAEVLARMLSENAAQSCTLLAWSDASVVVGMAEYQRAGAGEVEVAVVVGEAWRRVGLAACLLRALGAHSQGWGIERISAEILRDNVAALSLALHAGCVIEPGRAAPGSVRVVRSAH